MYIIFALLDTVFCESSLPRSPQDKQRRAKKTFEEMMTYIPGIHSPFFQCYVNCNPPYCHIDISTFHKTNIQKQVVCVTGMS